MNTVSLIGRTTKEIVLKYTNDDLAIAEFTLAVNRMAKGEADFIRVKAFGKTAENCARYLGKGRLCGVNGRIQTGKYENSEGRTIYTFDVIAGSVEFLEWGEKVENRPVAERNSEYGTKTLFDEIDDDEIPF